MTAALALVAQAGVGFNAAGLVQLLIVAIVIGAIIYIASIIAAYLGAPQILMRIIYIIVAVIFCIYAIRILASFL